ncbi:DUF2306 domain-containing protein [Pseudooceanicola sp.]|uniref:DUF2306 domain-containing protein n=1 Tax=Pseudooceanicola sp. TaxID=1914328 RepID=UPI0035C75472
MSLTPLLSASVAIQIHVLAALLAILLLPLTLFRRRRDRVHKVAGYVWVTAMLTTAISSFWINGIRLIGPFSPIHLLSVLTLYNVIWAVVELRRGNRRAHEGILRATAYWSLGLAGLFTLIPGRMMAEALFGEAQVTGFLSVLTLVGLVAFRARVQRDLRGRRET